MDEVPEPSTRPEVAAKGSFGTVVWNVSDQLYGALPRDMRDAVLAMTVERKITPHFNKICEKMLRHAGLKQVEVSTLDPSWSFEDTEIICTDCGQITLIWQIGQGIWDALPEDQRGPLLRLAEASTLRFMHDVFAQLAQYGYRRFRL